MLDYLACFALGFMVATVLWNCYLYARQHPPRLIASTPWTTSPHDDDIEVRVVDGIVESRLKRSQV